MRLPRSAAFVGFALLGGTAHADGDALGDMMGPREIAVGEAMRGGASGASAIPLNPAGLPLTHDVVFEGGYGYRPSDQASIIGVSACDSTSAMPGCFFYDYAGASPNDPAVGMSAHTTTHVGGLALAFPVSPRVFLGSTLKYFHFDSSMTNLPSASGFNEDAGLTVRLTDLVNVGVAGYNLEGAESVEFPRAVGGGVFAHPIPSLAVSFDSRWRTDGSGARYGGGAELFIRTNNGQTGFPIRAGALRDNSLGATYVSGGLGLASMKYGIDVAARRAISGRDDTMVIASMRFYGPRLRGPALEEE